MTSRRSTNEVIGGIVKRRDYDCHGALAIKVNLRLTTNRTDNYICRENEKKLNSEDFQSWISILTRR